MKVIIPLIVVGLMLSATPNTHAQGILGKIKDKAKKVTEKKDEDKKEEPAPQSGGSAGGDAASGDDHAAAAGTGEPPLKVYQNYDFVPGEKIVFEDNFADDQDGEFPAHWKLEKGQAVVNKVSGKPALLLIDGNYGVVLPRMKTDDYLGDEFTIEFDFIFRTHEGSVGYPPGLDLYYMKDGVEQTLRVTFGEADAYIGELFKAYPDDLQKDFRDKWHHAALIMKNGQMKSYVDQYRICVNPNIDQRFTRFVVDGIGDENVPIIVTNVKVAQGGGMNVIGQKFTEGKLVTHGITFDVNKAQIRPESMGVLNGIVKLLKENAAMKVEIGGYTDADGDDAANLKLSQARADAVMQQLISMGIDASRLSAKGYGESHPIGDNATLEGKAANRRVEFVKK